MTFTTQGDSNQPEENLCQLGTLFQIMKQTVFFLLTSSIALLNLWSCNDEQVEPEPSCALNAVVEDHSGLDGCGFLFKLDNGEYLEPIWRWGFCGTPPLPEAAAEDPLWNFDFEDGQQVRIGFEVANQYGTSCMKGMPVIITCLEHLERSPAEPTELK